MKKIVTFVLIICCFFLVGCSSPKEGFREIIGKVTTSSIAEISIYAYDGAEQGLFMIPNMGHAFISVKNLSSIEPLNICGFELGMGEEVSVGLYGHDAHWGIWFNLETYYLANNLYPKVASITREISSQSQIDAMNSYASDHNYWTFSHNCTVFANKMWNLVAEDDAIRLRVTPSELKVQIQSFKGFKIEKQIESNQNPSFIKGGNLIYASPV